MTRGRRKIPVHVKGQSPPSSQKSAEETHNGTEHEHEELTQQANDMANLQTILQELRDFRRENADSLRGIKEDIKTTNKRIDEAEGRISEAEDKVQVMEEALLEMLKLQETLETRIIDQESRSRRENIRIHGIPEGSEDNSTSVAAFIEGLLREKLEIPTTSELKIERAHRSLGTKPTPESPPRSVVVKFASFKTKEEVLRLAWRKKGFDYREKKVYIDHDYAPDVLKKRREYSEAKKVLKENKLRFQTPFPAKLKVFYEEETCVYNTAAEATRDMARRGLPVSVFKPPASWFERIKTSMWRKPRAPKGGDKSAENPQMGYKKKLEAYRKD